MERKELIFFPVILREIKFYKIDLNPLSESLNDECLKELKERSCEIIKKKRKLQEEGENDIFRFFIETLEDANKTMEKK